MKQLVRFFVEKNEKFLEEVRLQLGASKGVTLSLRLRSAADGETPFIHFSAFVFGCFLGRNPHTTYWQGKYGFRFVPASNGVSVFSKVLKEKKMF